MKLSPEKSLFGYRPAYKQTEARNRGERATKTKNSTVFPTYTTESWMFSHHWLSTTATCKEETRQKGVVLSLRPPHNTSCENLVRD